MPLPNLPRKPVSVDEWRDDTLVLIYAGLQALSSQMEMLMTMGSDLKALVAELRTHIDHELEQLAAKVDSAVELDALKADVRDSMDSLHSAIDALKSDDEPVPPPAEPAP